MKIIHGNNLGVLRKLKVLWGNYKISKDKRILKQIKLLQKQLSRRRIVTLTPRQQFGMFWRFVKK